MNFDLEPPELAVREAARELAASVEPLAVEADARSALHPGMRDALRESGLARVVVPAAYGGHSDQVDPLLVCLVREQLMAVSTNLDSLFALQGIGSFAISVAGTDRQREEWLPRVAALDAIAALALTEEHAGSDLKALSTSLRADGDDVVLDGTKTFISNAGAADFYTVLAREGDGYTTVLVPADSPGVDVTPEPELIAPHLLGCVRFDHVRLPGDARIGDAGDGFRYVLATLATFRVSVAGAALGIAQAALDEAARHAASREQFGRPLSQVGLVGAMLADSWTELESARLLTYRAATWARRDPAAAIDHSSMAKLAATEAAGRIVDRCVQIMGRWGLIRDSKVERLYRAARPLRIYEGASDVLRLGVAKRLVREVT